MKRITAEKFLKNVKGHTMEVLRDDGVYRHVKFLGAPPHAWNQWFELITWPGSLAFSGDMGTYVFSRVDDMFTFFRCGGELKINPHYWLEKVQAECKTDGCQEFCMDTFRENVLTRLDGYTDDENEDEDEGEPTKAEIIEQLESDVFSLDSEHEARAALNDFECEGFTFTDTWEIDGRAYTGRFIWCLYAIVWGIQQYDAAKQVQS